MSRRYRARKDRREAWYKQRVEIINHWANWSPRYLESHVVPPQLTEGEYWVFPVPDTEGTWYAEQAGT